MDEDSLRPTPDTKQHKLVAFGNIDQTADASYFVRFLDAAGADPSFQAYKRRTTVLLDARPGQRLLEVACGTGDDARVLASLVAPDGRVTAIDNSAAMVAEARQRAAAAGLPIDFQVGNAQHLELPDSSFDGCRCDRGFMHIPDPRQALAEMVRVAKPGGRIVVFEVDFETMTIDAPERPLARKIVNAWTDGFRNGWLGRYVPGFYRAQGLTDVIVEPHVLRTIAPLASEVFGPKTVARALAVGAVNESEAAAWLTYLDAALETGQFFSTLTGFLVSGRKPSR
jgi:ubiquinone/menaquinone biosynthesis C-methylase UbiE